MLGKPGPDRDIDGFQHAIGEKDLDYCKADAHRHYVAQRHTWIGPDPRPQQENKRLMGDVERV